MSNAKIKLLLEKGILVSPDLSEEDIDSLVKQSDLTEVVVLNKDAQQPLDSKDDVQVLMSYKEPSKKWKVEDFVAHFNARFSALELMLRNRPELQRLVSISKLLGRRDKETTSIIGMVLDKSVTANNNILLKLEDQTGIISVLFHKNRPELFALAKDLVMDEVVGISGTLSDGSNPILFANVLLLPDVPTSKELKKSPEDSFAVFSGDIHFGSTLFLEKEFKRFLAWLQGKEGSDEQKLLASKVKYFFIPGDLVEGVGIYPSQEKDLTILDIREQYAGLARCLKQIPLHVKIVICPGNHDAGRLSEPQLPLYKDYADPLLKLPNITVLSNPCWVNVGSSADFSGFDVLMYHGFSMTHYGDKVDSLREKGGLKRAELIMKFLLQRRHLAPTHASNLYVPDPHRDPLVIDRVPDFFVTGHVHRISAATYRNVSLLNCGCWSKLSPYQEKFGLSPQPAKVLMVNLKTRESRVMNFAEDGE